VNDSRGEFQDEMRWKDDSEQGKVVYFVILSRHTPGETVGIYKRNTRENSGFLIDIRT
jgi:hypothetical protein